MSSTIVQCVDVSISIQDHVLLDHIFFEVYPGEIVGIMGPSGSGKSTLLKTLGLLMWPTSGTLILHQESLSFPSQRNPAREAQFMRTRIGMVFQQFYLWPHLTVMGNLTLAPSLVLGQKKDEIEARAHKWLTLLGLHHLDQMYPSRLSGGQQQRVAIARTLMMSPELILFDEPTSALDPHLIQGLRDIMLTLVDQGISLVIASHEVSLIRDLSDRVIFLEHGKILEEGSTQQVFEGPCHPRCSAFLGITS